MAGVSSNNSFSFAWRRSNAAATEIGWGIISERIRREYKRKREGRGRTTYDLELFVLQGSSGCTIRGLNPCLAITYVFGNVPRCLYSIVSLCSRLLSRWPATASRLMNSSYMQQSLTVRASWIASVKAAYRCSTQYEHGLLGQITGVIGYTARKSASAVCATWQRRGTVPSVLRISVSLEGGSSDWPGRRSPLLLRGFLVELWVGIRSAWSESESS